MSYQLYNDTSTIRIVENGKAISLPKTIALKVFGNELQIFLNEDSPYISIDYTTVTVPVVTSSEDLRSQVEAWLDGGVTVTIDDTNIVDAINNLEITADTINLNTDTLEAKLDIVNSNLTDGSQTTTITDGAGTVNTKQLGTAITGSDVGLVTQGVIHGLSTAGGGSYVDVKVSPSGSLTTEISNTDYSLRGTIDTNNSTSSPLNNNNTYTGTWVDCSAYASIVFHTITDKSGTLYIDFSSNASNTDRTISYDVIASTSEVHRVSVICKYYRIRFTNNSGSNQTYIRLQSLLGSQNPLTTKMSGTISEDQDTLITRTILAGETDGGQFYNVPVTPEGHLEVAVHSPRLPFGSLHTESLHPIFQTDAVYQVNSGQAYTTNILSGTVTASDSSFVISTGATQYAYAVLESRKRLRYRPGQGIIGRFTAMYTSPVANSYQIAGLGHAEDGVYFGYGNTNNLSDTSFGILYVQRGVRATYTLTLTTRATSAGNVTVTLNGVANTVALTNSTLQQNVWELSQATYAGWDAFPQGATVVFVRKSSGATAGSFTYGAGTTGSAASIAQTKAGAASTDTFIPQSTWNGDKLDGTGASGVTLDPTKYNVFQIGIQYLGAGAIIFQVETCAVDGNNPEWVTVHTMKLPNTLTKTSFGNPSFPFTAAVYSAGSTSNLTLKVGSFAGFIEGEKKLIGNRFSYNGSVTANTSAYNTEITILNPRYYSGRTNQAVVNLYSISFAQQHNNVTTVYLIKNGALVGAPNFSSYSTQSVTLTDTAATSVTFTDNSQMIWSGQIGATGEQTFAFTDEITLQPGEWLSLAAKTAVGSPSIQVTLNTREDQ